MTYTILIILIAIAFFIWYNNINKEPSGNQMKETAKPIDPINERFGEQPIEKQPIEKPIYIKEECKGGSSSNGYLIYFYDPKGKELNCGKFKGSPTITILEKEGDKVVAWCPCSGGAFLINNTNVDYLERKEKAATRLDQNGERGIVVSNFQLDEIVSLDVLIGTLDEKIPCLPNKPKAINVGWIDGAINLNDSRISDNRYTNPNPSSGCLKDDFHGYNFSLNSNDVTTPPGTNAHGTQTFGIYDKVTAGNNQFHTFVAPLIVNDLHSLICAIAYAGTMNFKAVNASVGFSIDARNGTENKALVELFKELLKPLARKNMLLVCSAGNCGISTDTDRRHYPSGLTAFDLPVISVAATDIRNKALADFSNYGVNTVDVAARGENVEIYVENGVGYVSGTSFAAPLVTAKVVEKQIAHPTWSWQQIKDSIIEESIKNHNLREIKGGVLSPRV